MNTNLAYELEFRDELIGGEIVAMSPQALTNHGRIMRNITNIFYNYLKDKTCEVFADGHDLYLTKDDRFVPDVMIVCNPDIIKPTGIYGAPTLVVEILSRSTARRDRGHKKDVYEMCGISEYWIVSPESRSIEIYLLKDGKYYLDNLYALFPDYDLERMTEEQLASIPKSFKCPLFSDLEIFIEDVFERVN